MSTQPTELRRSDRAVEFSLAVSGMTCGSWVARVEKFLKRVPGVEEAGVNLVTERATVSAAPSVSAEMLLNAVTKAGTRP